MKKANEVDHASFKTRRRRSLRPLAFVFIAVVIGATAVNVGRTLRPSLPAVNPDGEVTNIRFSIYVAAQNINAYREKHGELPRSIAMIGLADEGVTYQRHGTTYTLMGFAGEETVNYTDGEDLAEFAATVEQLFGEGTP